MNEQRIREIAGQCSSIAVEIPFFRGIENGLTWEATIQKARDLKFAELIVRECMSVADLPKNLTGQWDHLESSEVIARHFGVEE